jgi:serine/threonine protein kinase
VASPLFDQLQTVLAAQYKLLRELGRGGMATVYLATDQKHGRQVALKVLHPDLAATLGPERFRREIGFAATLSHPHILTVLDSGETSDRGESSYARRFTLARSISDARVCRNLL